MVGQIGAVVKTLGSQSWGGGFKSHLGLVVVTLSKSLYPHCFNQPISKTGTWPCAGVDMITVCGNMGYITVMTIQLLALL